MEPLTQAMAAEIAGGEVAPLFSAAPGTAMAETLNLDDIFADCFFSQDGEVDFLDDGLMSTAPDGAASSSGGAATSGSVLSHAGPAAAGGAGRSGAPASAEAGAGSGSGGGGEDPGSPRKRAPPGAALGDMTEAQKEERRERNREHAKRSRVRKKFLLESLQQSVNALSSENEKLRGAIRDKLGDAGAASLLARCDGERKKNSLIANNPSDATRVLDDPDYSLVKALQTAQQNFVITDPSLPDNPIVFASSGFLTLTGYALESVLGRNCRFLQGPRTDPKAVAKIRKAVDEGYDTSVCLLNYRIDGSTFYNQFFVAPLRDGQGNVVNYVGVQCQVSDQFASAVSRDDVSSLPPLG